MILADRSLYNLLSLLIPRDHERDVQLINPASIDIRIGRKMLIETQPTHEQLQQWEAEGDLPRRPRPSRMVDVDLTVFNADKPFYFAPRSFALVEVYEWIEVPNGYAVELKLKSSRAREGWNHSLAFWVDPGWRGYLTMEIHNITKWTSLGLYTGLRFAQIIVHQLDDVAVHPYTGKYNNAGGVEPAKP